MSETLLKLQGYRKNGLLDADSIDFPTYKPSGKLQGPVVLPNGDIDLNIYFQDQGKTSRCTAYGLTHAVEIEITKKKKVQAYINAEALWSLQLNTGATEKYGDALQNAIRSSKLGMYDFSTKTTYKPKVSQILKSDLKKAVQDRDCTVYTGILADWPTCTADWVWRDTGRGGGHAICIIDYKDGFYWALNSWYKYGIKGTGVFKIREEDAKHLFTAFAVTI